MLKRFTNLRLFGASPDNAGEHWFDEFWVDELGCVCAPEPEASHQVFDLEGAVVLPAFADRHAHPVLAGRELLSASITDATSVADIVSRLKAFLAANPNAESIVAGAYDRNLVPNGRFEAAWLDEVSNTFPIVLHANDHHTIWVNSVALRIAGLVGDGDRPLNLPVLDFGSIDVNQHGRATGVLREDQAKQMVLKRLAKPSRQMNLQALLAAQEQLLAWGITHVVDAYVDDDIALAYLDALKADQLEVSFNLLVGTSPESLSSQVAQATKWRAEFESFAQTQVRVTGLKVFADGVLGSASAAVRESYLDAAGEPTGNHGDLLWSDHELAEALSAAKDNALEVHIHAIGDAAIEQVLRVTKTAIEKPRITVAHAELADKAQLAKLAQLGFRLNFQPLWARPDAMMHSCASALGPERTNTLYRHRSALEAGLEVEFGSDWPVSDANPLLGIYTAVFRQLPDSSETHNPAEALSLTQALCAYRASDLALGSRADFCALDADVINDPTLLAGAKVTQTFIGGQPKLTRQ